MRPKTVAIAVLMSVWASGAAWADVRVTLAKDTREGRRAAAYIEDLGARYLRPGQNLKVEILEYRPGIGRDPWRHDPWFGRRSGHRPGWHGYPYGPWRDPFFDRFDRSREPRLKVRYTLSEKGKTVLAKTETIRGWSTYSRFGASFSDDRDEVRRWFRRRFASDRPASS